MEHQREHLNGDLEVGYADVMQEHIPRKAATHAAPPAWLVRWEDSRPRILSELFAECLGVFIYVFLGVGAGTCFFITTVGKEAGFGSLLNISIAYGLGITFAILICGPASGGHLSPCFTIAFWIFKGFPTKKVAPYIIAQILGGFIGAAAVYGIYKPQLDAITMEFKAGGLPIFSPTGPAGQIALFIGAEQPIRYTFVNEFVATVFLAFLVFSVLDPSNIFISFASAPFVIGLGYTAIIIAFAAVPGLSLNTARDLGARMLAACVWGRGAFTAQSRYTALAALTNILGTLVGAFLQIMLLSDSARPLTAHLPDPSGPTMRDPSKAPSVMSHGNFSGDGGAALGQKTRSQGFSAMSEKH